MDPATYNGADRGAYRWSQTHTDLDVQIVVPDTVVSCQDIEVHIKPQSLHVRHGDHMLVDGQLTHAVRNTESFWTLLPRQHIHVQLEKFRPRWWGSLLQGDPDIDVLAKELPLEELPSEEAMLVEQLRWQDLQKQQQQQQQRRAAQGDCEPGHPGVPRRA